MVENSHVPGLRADFTTEFEVIRLCARTEVQGDFEDRIRKLLQSGIDWKLLIRLAIDHQVLPLVYQGLSRAPADIVPAKIMAECQQQCVASLQNNLSLLVKLLQVVHLLSEADIPCIPYKGAPLAVLAYGGNFGLRPFGDLDILVPPEAYEETLDLFRERGYLGGADWGWEASVVDPADGVAVDIHRALTPIHFPIDLDFVRLQRRLKALPVSGREIRSLGPEDMLIILCIQLAKDSWGNNPLRVSKLCDIAELLRAQPAMDWESVSRKARRLGCQRILFLGIELARDLLGAPTPPLRIKSLHRSQLAALREHVVDKLLNQAAPGYVRLLERDRFHFLIRERWRDRLFPYFHDFRRSFVPSEKDRQFLTLPRSLDPLYFAVRPLRVVRDLVHSAWVNARRR